MSTPLPAFKALLKQLRQTLEAGQTVTLPPELPPTFTQVAQTFGLSDFEQLILLLCLGAQLDYQWPDLLAKIPPFQPYPTYKLAQTVYAKSLWTAHLPTSPLRQWQLITINPKHPILTTSLLLPERLLHAILGHHPLEEKLHRLLRPLNAKHNPLPSQHLTITRIAATWHTQMSSHDLPPILHLQSPDSDNRRDTAYWVCQQLGYTPHHLLPAALPTDPTQLQTLLRLWEREVKLHPVALVVDRNSLNATHIPYQRSPDLFTLLDTLHSPILVLSEDAPSSRDRPWMTFELENPNRSEQLQLWQQTLPHPLTPEQLKPITQQFNLNRQQLEAACLQVQQADNSGAPDPQTQIWNACRAQIRPQLDELAQHLTTRESWEDLILPETQTQTLKDLMNRIKYRDKVYEDWGMGSKTNRGFGITALFAGASGTGKTMAANVIAQNLNLDLYRIDLSATVSKYIGETEKNLKRIFDAAESGGVVLLFDEADAIFGKRSPVNDSRDRYANLEVSYLLQRLETYNGLAILTTNLKESIDPAFLRRLQFVVRFPFPDEGQRRKIWQRVYPETVPTENLSFQKLAKLNVAGGNIRNIALNAAFKAAAAGTGVTMAHLLAATEGEFRKLEQPLPSREVEDWLKPEEPQQAITEALFSLDGVHWEDAMITEEELAEWRRKEQAEIAELRRQEREGDF
ncbi:MAG: AAA family ATPase [Cyanobacteria bacterium P01_G01_bin.54]